MSLLQRKGLGLKGWVLAGAAAAVFAVGGVILGCGDDGDSNTPGGGDEPQYRGGDSRLVGDWVVLRYVGNDGDVNEEGKNNKEIYRLMSSGKLGLGGFRNMGDFWIEGWQYDTTGLTSWRTEGQILYLHNNHYPDEDIISSYSLSNNGNQLTLLRCYYDEEDNCSETVLAKNAVGAVKGTLGTVYGTDPALRSEASKPNTDIIWVLQSDESQELEFYAMSFYDRERYYYNGDYYYSNEYWYTNDSRTRLILLYGARDYSYDDDGNYVEGEFTVEQRLELAYNVTGSGTNKTLTINRVLSNGTVSQSTDVWKSVERSWDDDYAPAKSRQPDKVPDKRIFPRPHAWGR